MSSNKKRPGSAATPLRAGDTRAICEASSSNAYSNISAPAGQRSIADLLGVGRENAITRRDLERLTGLAPREVSLAVERERRSGVPILADGSGYYLPSSHDERAACVRSLRHRAREILITARSIERAEG